MSYLSRRRWMLQAGAALAGAGVVARSQADRFSNPELFDVHLHIPSQNGAVFQGLYGPTRTMDDFVRYLDRCGVRRGIISSAQSVWATSPEEFRAGNREVARWAAKHSHRFAGACVVHPIYIEEALREIEDCHKEFGTIWVGEVINYHKPYGWSYNIRQMQQVVEQVARLKMALHIHSSEPEEIRAVAEAPGFAGTPVVWAHLKEATFYEQVDVLRRYPNTYLDIAAGVNLAMGSVEYAVKHLGSKRVLFGSDFTVVDPCVTRARIEHAYLTTEEKQDILSRNAYQLLARLGKIFPTA